MCMYPSTFSPKSCKSEGTNYIKEFLVKVLPEQMIVIVQF